MIAPTLRHCLMGALLLHTALICVAIAMLPPAQAPIGVVETFIIASPGVRSLEKKRTIAPHAGTSLPPVIKKSAPPPPVPPLKNSPSIRTSQDVVAAAVPAHKTPVLELLPPAESLAPAREEPTPVHSAPVPSGEQESPSALSSRQSAETEQVLVMGGDGAPRFIQRELPLYPYLARKLGKEGTVVLKLALDIQGQLQGIEIVEANGFGFAEAARTAIRKSTFTPAVRDGSAIPSQVLVSFRFVLHEG